MFSPDKGIANTELPPRPTDSRLLRTYSHLPKFQPGATVRANSNFKELRTVVEQSQRDRSGLSSELGNAREANNKQLRQISGLKLEIIRLKQQLVERDRLLLDLQQSTSNSIKTLLEENSYLAVENGRLEESAQSCKMEAIDLRSRVIILQDELDYVQRLKLQLLQNNQAFEFKLNALSAKEKIVQSRQIQLQHDKAQLERRVQDESLEKQLLVDQNQLFKKEIAKRDNLLQSFQKSHSKRTNSERRLLSSKNTENEEYSGDKGVAKWLGRINDRQTSLEQCARRSSNFVISFVDMAGKLFGAERYSSQPWSKRLQTAWHDVKQVMAGSLH